MDDGEHLWQLFQVVYWQGVWTQIVRYNGPPCPCGILGNHCRCTNISDKWSPWDFYFHFIHTYCIYCMASVNSCLMNGKLSIIVNVIEADVLFEGLGSLGGGSCVSQTHGFPRDGKSHSLQTQANEISTAEMLMDRSTETGPVLDIDWGARHGSLSGAHCSDMFIPSGGPQPDHSPADQTVILSISPQS